MSKRLIYLVGPPGSGKSTLMAKLTAGFDRHSIGPAEHYPVAHDVLTARPGGEIVGAEIGIRRELFSGTDALPSSIIDKAAPWIKAHPYPLVLAEGARLANKRFLTAAIEGGYTPLLALLEHDQAEEWHLARSEAIGRSQNESWVKGRITASLKLAEWAEGEAIEVLRGHPDDLLPQLAVVISADG